MAIISLEINDADINKWEAMPNKAEKVSILINEWHETIMRPQEGVEYKSIPEALAARKHYGTEANNSFVTQNEQYKRIEEMT